MPRPPVDLPRKIRDILQHVQPLPDEARAPILHYRRTGARHLGFIGVHRACGWSGRALPSGSGSPSWSAL